MLSYAIVSGHIIQYQTSSLKHEVSEYDHKTPMVRYLSPWGVNTITTADNFIAGSLEELKAIVAEWDRVHREKVAKAQSRFPQATSTEKQIIDFMVGDGCKPDDIDYDEVRHIAYTITQDYYRECCNSLLEAYMDYVH